MTAATIKQIYDAYPGSDLFPLEVTEETTLEEIEDCADQLGDTLFVFICRELCDDNDVLEPGEALNRLTRAMLDVAQVRIAFTPPRKERGPHLARLMSTHTHSIFNMAPGEHLTFSLGKHNVLYLERGLGDNVNAYRAGPHFQETEYVGNLYGAIERYMQFALSIAELIIVVNDDV